MSVLTAEQPVDVAMSLASNTFVLGNHALRSAWTNSFYVPSDGKVRFVNEFLNSGMIGYGGVSNGFGGVTTFGIGGQEEVTVNDPGFGSQQVSVSAPGVSLAVLVLDAIRRVQQVIDVRASYLSAAPDLGSGMTESVADATLRVNFQNNFYVPRTFALSPTLPPDLVLPAPGFRLGSGSVVLSGNVITTPTTYLTSTYKPNVVNNPIYAFYGTLKTGLTQVYVDPTTGALATRPTQTSGVFPANCLPICEVTVDASGLIRNIFDLRPSYI